MIVLSAEAALKIARKEGSLSEGAFGISLFRGMLVLWKIQGLGGP